jgi:N-[(2S)-2-amino-2-carboxyethyl]-L-glutamate dehydrogenase
MSVADLRLPGGIPSFAVIPGAQVREVLHGHEERVLDLVEHAYRLHGVGATVNPRSFFLTFPDRPAQRIIALPGSVGADVQVDGIKWISSVPANVSSGLPRASAVLVLNDQQTGYPFGCLEASIISAARTAASAAMAADWLSRDRGRPPRVGFFGTGLIARYTHAYLAAAGWRFSDVGVYDSNPEHAAGFAGYLGRASGGGAVTVHSRPRDLIESADLIVFATVAPGPHVLEPCWFSHAPLVLHLSLRDLSPEVICSAVNVVDDVEHCLTAATSVHLAEQATGGREFLAGTLFDVMAGMPVPAGRPVIFSPFGLGVLDLVLAKYVYDEVSRRGELNTIDGFFAELQRYGAAPAVSGAGARP